MNDQQLALVTFEQAKRLEATGFDLLCDTFYDNSCARLLPRFAELQAPLCDGISAPTVALALKWMRDVKNKVESCIFYQPVGMWADSGYRADLGHGRRSDCFDTYEAAESALLDALLTIIEE